MHSSKAWLCLGLHLWGLGFPALWPLVAFLALTSWLSMQPVSSSAFLKRPSLPIAPSSQGFGGPGCFFPPPPWYRWETGPERGRDLPGYTQQIPGGPAQQCSARVSCCLAAEILKKSQRKPASSQTGDVQPWGPGEVAKEGSAHSRENPDCRMPPPTRSQRAWWQSRMGWDRKMLGCVWDGAGHQAGSSTSRVTLCPRGS